MSDCAELYGSLDEFPHSIPRTFPRLLLSYGRMRATKDRLSHGEQFWMERKWSELEVAHGPCCLQNPKALRELKRCVYGLMQRRRDLSYEESPEAYWARPLRNRRRIAKEKKG